MLEPASIKQPHHGYKLIFMIDLGYIQSIKQFTGTLLSVGCAICLSNCLYIRFEALTDDLLSVGCTCPYAQNVRLAISNKTM